MMAKVKVSGTVNPTLQAVSSITIMVMSPATIGSTKSSSLASKKDKVKYHQKRYGK